MNNCGSCANSYGLDDVVYCRIDDQRAEKTCEFYEYEPGTDADHIGDANEMIAQQSPTVEKLDISNQGLDISKPAKTDLPTVEIDDELLL